MALIMPSAAFRARTPATTELSEWNLDAKGCCNKCGTPLAGVFEAKAGV